MPRRRPLFLGKLDIFLIHTLGVTYMVNQPEITNRQSYSKATGAIIAAFLASMIFAEALGWLNLVALAIILLGIYLAITSEAGIADQAEECKELSPEATD